MAGYVTEYVRIILTGEVVPVYAWLEDGVVAYVPEKGLATLFAWEYEEVRKG